MSDHPKIDEALARAMYTEQMNPLAGVRPWKVVVETRQFTNSYDHWMKKAAVVRKSLLRAGYRIDLDTAALLEKGKESGVRLTSPLLDAFSETVPNTCHMQCRTIYDCPSRPNCANDDLRA